MKEMKKQLLKFIVAHNEEQLKKVDWDQNHAEGLITLHEETEGIDVWDSFREVTWRFDVDPFEEYGESKLDKMIADFESQYGHIHGVRLAEHRENKLKESGWEKVTMDLYRHPESSYIISTIAIHTIVHDKAHMKPYDGIANFDTVEEAIEWVKITMKEAQ